MNNSPFAALKAELAALQHEAFEPEKLTKQQAFFMVSPYQYTWFCGGIGSGKCLAPGTPLLMYDGSIKNVEDLIEGDILMGWDNTPRPVTSTTSGTDQMFRITPVKGQPHDVNSAHIMTLMRNDPGRIDNTPYDIPLNQYETLSERCRRTSYLFRVPVEYPEKDVPLSPYFVGLWLGDGHAHAPIITSNDPEIHRYLEDFAKSWRLPFKHTIDKRTQAHYLALTQDSYVTAQGGQENPIMKHLRACLTTGAKRIPQDYLTGSREQRLQLLAGLIDSDGYLGTNTIEFSTKSEGLRDDVLYLARSVGMAAYASEKRIKIREGDTRSYWRVCISGHLDQIPTIIARKQAGPRGQVKNHLYTGIKSIEPLGEGTYYGFTVIGDGRVVLGDFTVTHNTFIGSRYATNRCTDNPETIGLITANTYDQLNHATLPPLMEYLQTNGIEYVKDKQPPVEWGFNPKLGSYRNVLTMETGAHVLLRSLDNFDPIRGVEIGWAWMDEIQGTTKQAWDVVIGRLRCKHSHRREIRVTGTPQGENWTWDEFSSPKNTKTHKVIFASTLDNPNLPPDYIEGLFANYDALTALQEIYGKIVKTNDGKIYYNFSRSRHISDVMATYDPSLPLLLTWDFNIGIRPMSCIVCQIQYSRLLRKDIVLALDELVIPFSNTPQIMKLITERYAGHTGKWKIYGDTQGLTRGASAGKTDYFVMEEAIHENFGKYMPNGEDRLSFHTRTTNPLVADRIQAVNTMLLNMALEVRIYMHSRCEELILDFEKVTPGQKNDVLINKNDPKRTHPSDAFGYLVAYEFPVMRHQAGGGSGRNLMISGKR